MEKLYRKTNIMYIPVLVVLCIFVVYPFFDGLRISLTNWNGFSRKYSFVGLSNFARLFTDENVSTAFFNTLVYGFGSTLFQQLLGLAYALLLTGATFAGRTLVRTIIYLPVLISALIMAYMWYYVVQYDGALNDILQLFGVGKVLWLSQSGLAVTVFVFINTVQYVGVSMVIYIAGIQGIPSMYYEAAELEGAGFSKRFFHVTLPLLYPALMTSITINLIGGFKLFDIIRALTNGGPGYSTHSLATLINSSYFSSQQAGFAAAIGLLLFVTIMVVTIALQRVFRGREVEYS